MSFPPGTKMFQFPGFALIPYFIQALIILYEVRSELHGSSLLTYGLGCPIRKFADQSLFAAPHNLSQRITSFIASDCQGIHQMPLLYLNFTYMQN